MASYWKGFGEFSFSFAIWVAADIRFGASVPSWTITLQSKWEALNFTDVLVFVTVTGTIPFISFEMELCQKISKNPLIRHSYSKEKEVKYMFWIGYWILIMWPEMLFFSPLFLLSPVCFFFTHCINIGCFLKICLLTRYFNY